MRTTRTRTTTTTATATTTPPPPPPSSSSAQSDGVPRAPRRWAVGTLVYSTAGLAALVGWLLWGDFVWQLKERGLNPVAQLVLKELRAADFTIGLLVYSLPALLGMVLGPIVCTHSDRYRGRWGRRIPYLLIPTPLAAAALAGLAFANELGLALHERLGDHSPGMDELRLAVFAFFWTVSELASLTAQYLFYGLINDVIPREFIGRFFGLFRAVSLLAGIAFNFWVIGYADGYAKWIFLGLAVIYGVGFSLMCLRVKEGQYPPPEPLVTRASESWLAPVMAYFRESFTNPFYLWVYAGMTLAALAFVPVNAFTVLYARSLGMTMETYGRYQAMTYTISFALSYGLGSLADRFHPLRVGVVTMFVYAGAMIWGGVFATTPQTFAVAFVAHGVVSGAFFTVQVPIFQRLFPQAKFGQFVSAAFLLLNLGSVILPMAMGQALDMSGSVYRHTLLTGGTIGVLAFAALLVVERKRSRAAII